MQVFKNAFEIEINNLKQSYMYIQTAIQKPHGNHKSKVYNTYTHKKENRITHNTKDSHQITR